MKNTLLRLFGWPGSLLLGDPTVVDRWKWLKRHLRGGPLRTLDAGCGSGPFTMYAALMGNEAVGLTFEARSVRTAQTRAEILKIPGVRFLEADLRRLDELAGSLGTFDQILLIETIEHIKNDAKVVADLVALLRPGGTLLLTTPFKHHRRLWGETISEDENGAHVRWGYTHEELRALFQQNGLEVLAEEFISGLASQKIAELMFNLGRIHLGMAWAATFPLRVFHPLDGPLTRLTSYPALSVGIVGRKPERGEVTH